MTRFSKSSLGQQLFYISEHTKNKTRYLRDSFPRMIAILLIGFLSGNLFGTTLFFVRRFLLWDGYVIAGCLIVLETISYISYKPRRYNCLQPSDLLYFDDGTTFTKQGSAYTKGEGRTGATSGDARAAAAKRVQQNYFFPPLYLKAIAFFKVGVMIGFFVDAFKVGS